jgi:hypothetical protein
MAKSCKSLPKPTSRKLQVKFEKRIKNNHEVINKLQ